MIKTWLKKELNHWTGETAFLFTHFSLLCSMTAFLIWVLLSKESGSAQATLCRGLLLCFHSVDNDLLYWEDSSLLSFAALATTPATQLSCYHLPPWALTLYFASLVSVLLVNSHIFLFCLMKCLQLTFFILDSDELLGSVVLVFQYFRKFSFWNKKLECKYEASENGEKYLTLKQWLKRNSFPWTMTYVFREKKPSVRFFYIYWPTTHE